MRIKVGTLRRIIREMKLGVASANPPGEAWGLKDEPMYDPGKEGSEYIATEDPPNYDPGEDVRALYRPRGGIDMAGDEIDDELEDELAADVEKTRPTPKQKSAGMRANMPVKSARG